MKYVVFFFALAAIWVQITLAKKDEEDTPVVSRRSTEVDMGSVDDFDITEYNTPIHNSDEWKNLSPEDRRKMAVEFYYSILGLCAKRGIQHCSESDAKYIAKAFTRGDPECFFYCGYDQMKAKADQLPSDYTLALSIDIGLDWTKEVKAVSDMERLDTAGRRKTGSLKKKSKRIIIFPIVFAALGAIINIGSMAAVGYFSNDRNIDEMGTLASKSGAIRAALNPALKVTKVAGRGCFDVKGAVNIKDNQGNHFSKKLGALQVGDYVESVSDNGEIVFSRVYYIAHGDGKKHAKLLRVYYEEDNGKMNSIGLSERHLIYSNKADSGVIDAQKAKPIMASKLSKGDLVWVREDEGLVAKKVSEVLPYIGNVIHPLTDNHHIIVDGVHASVHILNESAYRMMTTPLKWVCWLSPQAGKSKLVNKLVRFVENAKEPFASKAIGDVFDGREVQMGIYGMS